jgi:hypothetical protein
LHEHFIGKIFLLLLLVGVLGLPTPGLCATYGVKTADGGFSPKVTVSIDEKEVTISKANPQERFQSILLKINSKYYALARNVGLLDVVWIGETNKPGRPARFAGPKYNSRTMSFKDSMGKSLRLKIIDTSTQKLFSHKEMDDLFKIEVNDEVLVSGDSFESGKVVTSQGQDVSIYVNKTSVQFNEENVRKGEIINVENRTGRQQVLGVVAPEEGLNYLGIGRLSGQTTNQRKIPRESWGRFTVEPESGIFITIVPNPDQRQLAQLNGKEIRIDVYEGANVRPVRRIPIQVAPELRLSSGTETGQGDDSTYAQSTTASVPRGSGKGPERPTQAPGETGGTTSIWMWIFQILNLALLVGGASYGIFFVLPKMQVLEDRLAKNEMFIHGSREAIREELEQTKKEIFSKCLPPPESEME